MQFQLCFSESTFQNQSLAHGLSVLLLIYFPCELRSFAKVIGKGFLWVLRVHRDTRLLSEKIIELDQCYDVYNFVSNAERSQNNVS